MTKNKQKTGEISEGQCCKSCEGSGDCWPSWTRMRMVRVSKIREEFEHNRTFYMDEELQFSPGQFLMVWLPGVDEKPIAIIQHGKKYALNIEGKGAATKKMLALRPGDRLGVRGPYGRGFTTKGVKKAVIVAGGVGIDSIVKLAQDLKGQRCQTTIILGGRSKERIIFEKELGKLGKVLVATDDGSYGEKGYNVQILERVLSGSKGKGSLMVYACGPEIMIVKALEIARKHKARFEASLERYMKCGIGVCGECVIDDKLVCVDGPVFSGEELSRMTEFGKTAYLKSGRRVTLEEYYEWRQG